MLQKSNYAKRLRNQVVITDSEASIGVQRSLFDESKEHSSALLTKVSKSTDVCRQLC